MDAQVLSRQSTPATAPSGNSVREPARPLHFLGRSQPIHRPIPAPAIKPGFKADPRFLRSHAAAAPSTPGASGPWLQTRQPLPAGEIPTSVGIADFNNDGKMDWVVANGWDDNLWIYFGNGDGTSALPTIIPLKGSSPLWVATGDLRKMGRADIVVAEHDSNKIGVLLSNGDGTFQPEQQYSTLGISPNFITLADVNRDGFLDLAAGGLGSAIIELGDGKGNFGAPQLTSGDLLAGGNFAPPHFTTFISFADFDKDGNEDMLISSSDSYVEVFHGDGAGNFASPVKVIGGANDFDYYYLASTALDFNGDGCPDVVTSNTEGAVFFFAGDCTGHFSQVAGLTVDAGDTPAQLAGVDVNGDGIADLVRPGWWERPRHLGR
jgi:hypothetical protein